MANCYWQGTATQRVWLIDEIVRNILANLPSVGSSRTLASCARVSSALSEPALDLLWSRMTGLSPLCELLPQCSDHPDADECKDGAATSSRRPSLVRRDVIADEDWSRFARYARRVRKLHYQCTESPSERVRQRTFAALVRRAARLGAPLLPRLEELSWLQFSHDITQYLHFLSPSLRRVTVYVQVGQGTGPSPPTPLPEPGNEYGLKPTAGLLHVLDELSPDVEELSLEGMELPNPTPASLEPLLAFKRLRSLHLGSLSAPVSVILSYCAAMPSLQSLSVDLTQCNSNLHLISRGTPPQDEPALHALEVLRVAGTPSTIEELLGAVHSAQLRSVSISVTIPEHDLTGGTRCLSVLGSRFSTSLQSVRVHYKHANSRMASPARPFAHYVQPLLPLRDLRECSVTIEDNAPIRMTNADVQTMAEGWPALSSLEVVLRSRAGAPAALPSITALESFARFCPDLTSLRLPLCPDLSALSASETTRSGAPVGRAHRLRSLWLSAVWFTREESRRVMRYLVQTFPSVDLLPMVSAGVLRRGGVYAV
ncbi:hypothetical protein BV20DRAFT_69513 [Pilatotrama ljubarskyi]|nr:hypothetical protein BV20DRAFT_69513 [Pilatotrama ljubarskyi]